MEFSYHAPALLRTATHIYLLPHPVLRQAVAHYTLCLPLPRVRTTERSLLWSPTPPAV